MSHKKNSISVRKALIQQEMVLQRRVLQQELQPVIRVGGRLRRLFNPVDKKTPQTRKTLILTSMALFLAILGRRRAGLLGKASRYVIINYPGILRRFM